MSQWLRHIHGRPASAEENFKRCTGCEASSALKLKCFCTSEWLECGCCTKMALEKGATEFCVENWKHDNLDKKLWLWWLQYRAIASIVSKSPQKLPCVCVPNVTQMATIVPQRGGYRVQDWCLSQTILSCWLDLKFEGDFVQTLLPAHCCTLYNLDKGFPNCETFKPKPGAVQTHLSPHNLRWFKCRFTNLICKPLLKSHQVILEIGRAPVDDIKIWNINEN